MRADLHSHTLYSDGELKPQELLERAKKNGIDILAVTDHDTFKGSEEAYEIAPNIGMRAIYGMELSTKSNGESIHVLCYFSRPNQNNGLYKIMENQRLVRKNRAYKIANLLHEYFGFQLDTSFIENRHSITRGTIANEIVNQGYATSKKDVFKKMIGDDCPCYLPSTELSFEDGVKLIKENGGMCVLAHPCLYKKNNIEDLIKVGIDGIEAVYPDKGNVESKYRDLAKKYNIIVTGGSDFHKDNDYKHADVGTCYIKDQDLRKFLRVLENEH